MRPSIRISATALLTCVSIFTSPSHAQSVPPAPSIVIMQTGGMFANLSPQGQAILRDAMRDRRSASEIEALRAARQRVLSLIAQDRLDVAAIRRAQAEERRIVIEGHIRQQEAMLNAYTKLSLADRKAFVASMRHRETRMEDHIRAMRERIDRLNRMEEEIRERVNQRLRQQGLPPIKDKEI